MINAGILDIQIDQGSTFTLDIAVTDADGEAVSLSGASITGKIREAPESTAALATFTGTITSAADGEARLSLSSTTTAALAVDNSGSGKRKLTKRVWDAEIQYSDGTIQRILQGLCFISPEVNR